MYVHFVPILLLLSVPRVVGATDAEGEISGQVLYQGTPPTPRPLATAADPACARAELVDESLVVGARGGLKDAVVSLPPGTRGTGKPLPRAIIDQKGCRYSPRVQLLYRGQQASIKNSDPTIHNVHAFLDGETLTNQAQPAGAADLRYGEDREPGEVVRLKCDVHPWMEAYLYVTDHRFAGVTDGAGRFKIERVPPGAYILSAWHPVLGRRSTNVKVRAGKTSVVQFTFNGQGP
jgi:hypothetical protein